MTSRPLRDGDHYGPLPRKTRKLLDRCFRRFDETTGCWPQMGPQMGRRSCRRMIQFDRHDRRAHREIEVVRLTVPFIVPDCCNINL